MVADIKTMEVKKTQERTTTTNAAAAPSMARAKRVAGYLGDIKGEFAKITWTTREELQTYTKVVVATTFLLGLFIYAIDVVIQVSLNTVEMVAKALLG